MLLYLLYCQTNFNPRSLAGATFCSAVDFCQHRPISIHAPLRERPQYKPTRSHTSLFQSTLPCGSDSVSLGGLRSTITFQSTLPCGSDNLYNFAVCTCFISIHAPLRERLYIPSNSITASEFQSTLPCGSDLYIPSSSIIASLFQSTLPCGSDSIAIPRR